MMRKRTSSSPELPILQEPFDSRPKSMHRRRMRTTKKLIVGLATVTLVIYSYMYLYPASMSTSRTPYQPDQQKDITNTSDVAKQKEIVEAFKYAWLAYERDAMGYDEYHPITHRGSNIVKAGGIGYTVVDALDTMILMGLDEEYQRAREWVNKEMTFDRDGTFSTFEVTIRVFGGLLAAYNLTGDTLFLDRVVDLAQRMLPAFDTHSGLPTPSVNLANRVGVRDEYVPDSISTAEASTLQLEFRYLAELTGNTDYWYKAEKAMAVIDKADKPYNLVPIHMSLAKGDFVSSDIRLGSRGDSYYEYLLKQYLQTNRTEKIYDEMYNAAIQGVHDKLVQKTITKNMTYIAELVPSGYIDGKQNYKLQAKQDHLVCFFAGSLMLGATTSGALVESVSVPPRMEELSQTGQRDWQTGIDLLETCMYTHETSTGLSPEIAHFKTEDNSHQHDTETDWYIKNSRKGGPSSYDARYMLRPETVESLFIAWRLTGDTKYREYSWNIFSSINKYARLESGGYATIMDVDTVPIRSEDKQETFFLSETLKYIYLTFSNSSLIPLDKYVFNTEAHPIPIFTPSITPQFTRS